MRRSLRIAVADDEAVMRQYFQEILPLLGHRVVSAAQNGRELVEQSVASCPDLVITDIRMPDMDGIDAIAEIDRHRPTPAIIVSAFHETALLERAAAAHVLAFLVKPIGQPNLESAIAIAMRRFEEFQELRKQTADLEQALEDRKVIERAKGILMKWAKLDEAEAFRMLQAMASHERKMLAEMARAIVAKERSSVPQPG